MTTRKISVDVLEDVYKCPKCNTENPFVCTGCGYNLMSPIGADIINLYGELQLLQSQHAYCVPALEHGKALLIMAGVREHPETAAEAVRLLRRAADHLEKESQA